MGNNLRTRSIIKIKGKKIKTFIEYVVTIIIAILLAKFLSTYVITSAVVPTQSMEPTINVDDRIMINRLSFKTKDVSRGDIVAFYYPDDESIIFLKRVIGLPGDVIYGKNNKVYINDIELNESKYLPNSAISDFGPYTVPDNSYFMLGDNRCNSLDSRYWTNKFVSKDKILGKTIIEYFPIIKIIK